MKATTKRILWPLLAVTVSFSCTLLSCDSGSNNEEEAPRYAEEFTAVRVEPNTPATLQIAIQACVGLRNRKLGGSAYILFEHQDPIWLEELGLEPSRTLSVNEFLEETMREFPKCVRYSYSLQQKLLPPILTIASVLEAIPLAVETGITCDEVAFDATATFSDLNTPYLATKYAFENYGDQTTGLAYLNPGYDLFATDLENPPITRDMPSYMIDFVFSRNLFLQFLVNGCAPGNPENELLDQIVNAGNWETPLGVYGYNNSWFVGGGFVHEALTRCLASRNMGTIATETSNMAFFSTRRPPIEDTNELEHNAPENITYDPTKTYVAFVIGDGDNVHFVMTTRREWMAHRLADCESPDNTCAPVTWTISPHLHEVAPDVLKWYYSKTRQAGNDYFCLPPCGHLYAYPTSLAAGVQDKFVRETERDAAILGTHSTVHWDWFDTWVDAENSFLPKYAKVNGSIKGIFPVNVPYFLPTFPWWEPNQFFKVLEGEDGGKVVVFNPREWRGVDGRRTPAYNVPFFLTPQQMADELAGYPAGTVAWVYMTSDGGLNLRNSFMEMVKVLPAHVQLVSTDAAAQLALASGR